MNKENLGKKIVEVACLRGEFILRSGRKSNYYLDKYLFETRPEILKPLAAEIAKLLPPEDQFDRLAGPELGAVAIAAAVSLETSLPYIIARKQAKDHGTNKLFEGKLDQGERLVLIEDVLTTGGQAIKSAQALQEFGCKIVMIIGVIDREEGAREAIEQAGFKLRSLFTKTELGL